ncbi:MAG: efflux RND transporter periplasmic adaptor subunit [Methylovulum sp.]|nr:efflux RND transporter periplasmic adaptor subunit [Methylovulum sp.]
MAFAVSCLTPGISPAADKAIRLSEAHINNLGVSLGKLMPVSQIPVLYAPAKVVIPPTQEYIVSASQAGLITRLNAAIGDKVKQGEVLAEINSSDLLSMQRLYLKANSELELGQFSYQRDKKLLEDGIIAARRWQETRSLYNAAASEADEHRQLLEIAGMTAGEIDKLKKTHRLSGLLNIRSPITGVIMERMAVAGARIDSLAPLYRIANLDELWLEINIPQERIGQIKIGDKVLLEKPATETQELEQRKVPLAMPISAQITLLGQTVNPENQTILARALLKGAPTDVRPGQRINTQIIQPNIGAAFNVPNTAIAQHEGKSFVFVRTVEGFNANPVTVIGRQGEESTISGNFTGTEMIAVKGAVSLKANWLGLGLGGED